MAVGAGVFVAVAMGVDVGVFLFGGAAVAPTAPGRPTITGVKVAAGPPGATVGGRAAVVMVAVAANAGAEQGGRAAVSCFQVQTALSGLGG